MAVLAAAVSTAAVVVSTAVSTFVSSSVPHLTLAAVGDIRLDGPVGAIIAEHGQDYPSARIRDLLKADIELGNLECPITQRGDKQSKKWNFRAKAKNLAALKKAGFGVLNVANNHSYDYGLVGFTDTLRAVKKAGFAIIGGGRNLAEASRPRVFEVDGIRVGLLGFTSTFPQQAWAKPGKPGVLFSDYDRVPELVRAAKEKCDVLVVSFHGGTELAEDPNDIQKAFMHQAVDAGADIVLGHHPHVLQPAEVYKGKPILYSLGNFFFVSPSTGTNVSAIARAVIAKDGVKEVELLPVDTNFGAPKPASPELRQAAVAALDRMGALTAHPELFQVVDR